MNDSKYGDCTACKVPLKAIWFEYTDESTGYRMRGVDCLVCDTCMKEYTIDDSFDWKINA